MGLLCETPPPGYRQLTSDDLTDAALRARLVAEHQVRGGWGLTKDPLPIVGVLVVADGDIQINGRCINVVGQGLTGVFAQGIYRAITFGSKVPWAVTPPAADAAWDISLLYSPLPSHPCLLMRVATGTSTHFVPPHQR